MGIPFHSITKNQKTQPKKIIRLFGGPGAGKSTSCAGLFYFLKKNGFNAEMSREYIKNWVWEGRSVKEGDQLYILAKQIRQERILVEKNLEYIITDSPTILAHFYGNKHDNIEKETKNCLKEHLAHEKWCTQNGYEIINIIIGRYKEYNPEGRFEDFETAKKYDLEIKNLLDSLNVEYFIWDSKSGNIEDLYNKITKE